MGVTRPARRSESRTRRPVRSRTSTPAPRRRAARAAGPRVARHAATGNAPILDAPLAFTRGRLPAGDRRLQILRAAFEVFSEQGFHGARTRDLARRAGVSEALVFRHFPTKDALIRAIIDLAGFENRIEMMEQQFGSMPPREALTALAEHVLTNLREQPDMFRVVFFGILETPELGGEFYRKFLSRLLALETRLFARAQAGRRGRGRSETVDPAVLARSFHGSLLFYNVASAIVRIEPLPQDPKALAAAIVNIHLPEASS